MSMISKQQFDFMAKPHTTRALEEQVAELTARLAKLEESK